MCKNLKEFLTQTRHITVAAPQPVKNKRIASYGCEDEKIPAENEWELCAQLAAPVRTRACPCYFHKRCSVHDRLDS